MNVLWLLEQVGLPTGPGVVSAAFAVIGLGLVVLGAWTYVLSTRFRTEEMGTARDAPATEVDDG